MGVGRSRAIGMPQWRPAPGNRRALADFHAEMPLAGSNSSASRSASDANRLAGLAAIGDALKYGRK